ncbi:MAG: hypothetical protein WDO73_07520 [Ignavibacteriota bacterium]
MALIDVQPTEYAALVLLARLMEDGIGGVEIGLRCIEPSLRREHLQIGAADGKRDQIARIFQAVLAGAGGGFGSFVIVDRRQVRHRLAETGLKIVEIERTRDRGNAKRPGREH